MDPAGDGEGDPPANRARGVVSDVEGGNEANAPPAEEQESTEIAPQQEPSNHDPAEQQQQQQQQQQQLQIQPYQPPPDNVHPFGAHPPAGFQPQQQGYSFPPAWSPHHGMVGPPPPPSLPRPGQPLMQPGNCPHPQQQTQHAAAMAFYEARMRDHAAAYASAAAGAAWAAAQIAQQAAEFAAVTHARGPGMPPIPPPPLDPTTGLPSPAAFGAPGFFSPDAGVMAGGAVDPNYFHQSGNSPQGGGLNHNSPPWQNHPYDPQNHHSNNNHWRNDPSPRGQQFNNRNSNNNNNNDENYDEAYATRNTRRKRTQRRPPGGISIPREDQHQHPPSAVTAGNNNNNNNNNSRVRRRLRDQGDSSNSSCATSITSYNSDQPYTYNETTGNNNNLGGHNNRGNGGNYGSPHPRGGGPRGHYHRYKKKMKQPKDDTSLLGKTGVSALFEWCGKRRIQPSFALLKPLHGSNVSVEAGEEFEMAVYLEDGVEVGRGHGPSKGSAKQDAARKALQSLVPGIVFDLGTGFVVELPESMVPPHMHAAVASSPSNHHHQRGENVNPASLEDLAPHLASRLAIASGREDNNDDGGRKIAAKVSGSQSYSKTLKRAWSVYPGTTSTTSEEDDENAYYASRGASVCSVLLHAMVQIDDRIPEAPQYEFEVAKVPTTNAQMKRKGPASSYGSAIVIQRGPFTCTATLKVVVTPEEVATAKEQENGSDPDATEVSSDCEEHKKSTSQVTKAEKESDKQKDCTPPESPESKQSLTTLTAVGVGGTKRESKHSASAKLLALLFPECKTMVEVKAAAEAAREAYAASKALSKNINNANNRRRREGRSKMPRLSLSSGIYQLNVTQSDDDPPLPPEIVKELRAILGVQEAKAASTICSQVASFEKLNLNPDSSSDAGEAKSESEDGGPNLDTKSSNSGVDSPASRRKQLDAQVDKALAVLNGYDEEGRSLPDELTVDDVGRTVLRRAEPEDIPRIRRLLSANSNDVDPFCPASVLGPTTDGDVNEDNNEKCTDEADRDDRALQLLGSSTIVLLLCRAIAAFEDPPLGCAVLVLGFSMQKGRLLRIAQIGSEKHLPRERFLECLEAFASSMQYSLERQEPPPSGEQTRGVVRLNREMLKAVLESNLQLGAKSPSAAKRGCERSHNVSAPLQSVLEESEGGDDSDRPKESSGKAKGEDKPCKRSRVE